MSVNFYMDVHVRRAVTVGLRLRGVDVLTAQEDGTTRQSDSQLLDRAANLSRVFVSYDVDLLREATRRERAGESFAGVIYIHPLRVSIGQAVTDLELIAKVCEPDDLRNRVEYLPLR